MFDGVAKQPSDDTWIMQAAILVKVHHEENPIDDCPKICVGVWTRHHGQKVFTGYKECGGGVKL